jgi:hypothetical protein
MGGMGYYQILLRRKNRLILEIATLPCPEQGEKLRAFFTHWKGEQLHLDDVTLIGLRLI